MASSKPGPDPPTLNATRQMLDELDALMERMLALPVNDIDEPASASPEPPAAPSKARPLAATLTLLQAPVDEAPASFQAPVAGASALPALDPPHARPNPSHLPTLRESPVPQVPEWSEIAHLPSLQYPPAEASEPELELPELPPAPEVAPAPLSDRVVPPPPEPNLNDLLADVPEPPASLASLFILPVLLGNRLYDQGTMLLGETGSWLRGPVVRSALGMAGLILFGAALLWLARDWLGWTW